MWTNVWKRVPHVWQIWDLDDPLEELHFSGHVEKLCETAEEKRGEVRNKYPLKHTPLHKNPDDLLHK